jgi:hypothetical protein
MDDADAVKEETTSSPALVHVIHDIKLWPRKSL